MKTTESPELETLKKIEENLDTIKEDHGDKISKLIIQVTEMQEDVQRSKENGGLISLKKPLASRKDVQKFISDTFDERGKTSHKASIDLNSGMVFKAAETMTSENFFTGSGTQSEVVTGYHLDPMFYQRRRKRNTILDHIPIETTDAPFLFYMEKQEVAGDNSSQEDVGAAEWITSVFEKPGRSFRMSTTKVEAKKVAIYSNVADKLLRDISSLTNWMQEDLIAEVKEAYNDALLNNDPGSNPDAPLGIKQNAVAFSVTQAFTNTVSQPNIIDVLVAASASMIAAKEQPGKFLISPDNYFALHILKDSQGRYLNGNMVYANGLGELFVAGIPVYAVDDEDVDSDHYMLLGADLGFRIKNYGPLRFERGLNADDFRKDKTSFRCYQEVISYIPAHKYNTVQHDTISNVLTAIDAGS